MQTTNAANNTAFKVFYVYDEKEKLGQVERIDLPTGETVLFDWEKGKIDLESMKPHIGEKFEFYRNDVSEGIQILNAIKPTKSGVMAMHYEAEDNKDEN